MFAIAKIGATTVAISTFSTQRELHWTLKHSRSSCVISISSLKNHNFIENLQELCPEYKETKVEKLRSKALQRLKNIMDEYLGCITSNYMTNGNLLKKALELLDWLQEDLENVGAEDYHQLMRAWELKHRALTSQCVTEHTLFREETRWPGYYYRGDYMKLDDENWHCLTVSRLSLINI